MIVKEKGEPGTEARYTYVQFCKRDGAIHNNPVSIVASAQLYKNHLVSIWYLIAKSFIGFQ